jgi:hypothetical protein
MNADPQKPILDACCGGRMFWFDKQNPLAFYIDARQMDAGFVDARPNFAVEPDAIMDFTNMEFDDETFYLTVFDPPHLKNNAGDTSYMVKKYGKLPKDWQSYIKKGFDECWRVTKTNGVIIFKWNETQIKTTDVIKAIGRQPLFGHTTNSRGTTKWMTFMKIGGDQ